MCSLKKEGISGQKQDDAHTISPERLSHAQMATAPGCSNHSWVANWGQLKYSTASPSTMVARISRAGGKLGHGPTGQRESNGAGCMTRDV